MGEPSTRVGEPDLRSHQQVDSVGKPDDPTSHTVPLDTLVRACHTPPNVEPNLVRCGQSELALVVRRSGSRRSVARGARAAAGASSLQPNIDYTGP